MKALVTGGAGFIGSFLCEDLLERNYEVVCLDNFWRGKRENTNHLLEKENFKLIKGDIKNIEDIRKAAKGCDFIYHLGAINGTKYFYERPILVLETNITGTKNVLEVAKENNIKVIFTSSSEVYGEPEKIPTPEDENCVLDNPTITQRHSYSTSKLVGEYLCLAYRDKFDISVSILRYFNVYGPRLIGTKYGQVVSIFFNQAMKDDDLTVYGDGTQTRSFTYVSDVTDATIEVGESDETNGEIYNVGRQKETTINELADEINSMVKSKKSEKVYEPLPKGDTNRRYPNIEKIKNTVNWEPKITLKEGLKITYEWFKEGEKNE